MPTRGRKDKLFQCLLAIANQTYKNWECIIVDDNNSDFNILDHSGIATFVLSNYVEIVRASYVTDGFPVHNIGVRESSGDIVFRLDDDVILDSKFVELALPAFKKNDVVAVGGCFLSKKRVSGGENSLFFYRSNDGIRFRHTLGVQMSRLPMQWVEVDHIHSSYMYRKSAILEIGGFDESIKNGEETVPFLHWAFRGYRSLINTGSVASHVSDSGGWRSSCRIFPDDEKNLQILIQKIFDQYGVQFNDGDSLKKLCENFRS